MAGKFNRTAFAVAVCLVLALAVSGCGNNPVDEKVYHHPLAVYNSSLPERAAYTGNGYLWIGGAGPGGAVPVSGTRDMAVTIVGWSPGGQWLAYLKGPVKDKFGDKNCLWVVRADGTGAYQVDSQTVTGMPAWSPDGDMIAYGTSSAEKRYTGNLKIARIANGKVSVSTLLPAGSNVIDYAWAPDGQSLAVSFPCTTDQPMRVERVTLQGKRTNLFSLGQPLTEKDKSGMYSWAVTAFKFSPDGRYLAYHLHPNSGSLTADGVDTQVVDLQKPGRTIDLGGTLNYAYWLAWSPDSRQLAYISGGGREATFNKHLRIVNMADGRITDCGRAGQADTWPVWTATAPYVVVFCRGPETVSWEGGSKRQAVLIPGQRIWMRLADGTEKPLTDGPAHTADYAPAVSPDGKNLFFTRLDKPDSGSLYVQPFSGGKQTVMLQLSASPGYIGYYGNYYPAWTAFYWPRNGK